MKVPKQKQISSSFCCFCKEPGHWKRGCYKFKHFRCLQPSNQPFQHPPNSQWWGSEEEQGLFPILPLNQLGETFLQIGDESLSVLNEIRATLSVPLPQSMKTVQIVRISNEPQNVAAFKASFLLRPFDYIQTLFSLVLPPLFIYLTETS